MVSVVGGGRHGVGHGTGQVDGFEADARGGVRIGRVLGALVTMGRGGGGSAGSSANTGVMGMWMKIMVIGIQVLDTGIQVIQRKIGFLILQNLISRIQVISSKHSILLQKLSPHLEDCRSLISGSL